MRKSSLYVIVVGCGGFGSYLANLLSRYGHSLVVIDPHAGSFENLSSMFSGFRIEGDATELEVLREAKIDRADVVIATTADDTINLMVCQVAKKRFNVPRVIARVLKPDREGVYHDLGIDSVCPTILFGDLIGDIIHSAASEESSDGGTAVKP